MRQGELIQLYQETVGQALAKHAFARNLASSVKGVLQNVFDFTELQLRNKDEQQAEVPSPDHLRFAAHREGLGFKISRDLPSYREAPAMMVLAEVQINYGDQDIIVTVDSVQAAAIPAGTAPNAETLRGIAASVAEAWAKKVGILSPW